jgi:uncharacterized repeat protein (TIGR01451 family)
MIRPLFLLLGFIVSAIPAAGASELELRGISSARLLAGDDGRRMVPTGADAAPMPGEERLYTLRFRNTAPEPAAGLILEFSLPAGLAYVPASASGPGTRVTVSVDGGSSFEPESSLGERAAGATHLRWTFRATLYPQTRGIVSFRGRSLPPPALPDGALPRLTGVDPWPDSGQAPEAGEGDIVDPSSDAPASPSPADPAPRPDDEPGGEAQGSNEAPVL